MNQPKFLLTRSQLLEQFKDDENQKDWTVLFNTYWKFIYNICRKSGLSDTDAQDVVQETMLTVARKIKEFNYERKKGYFKNWLKVITRSRIQDHWRKQNRRLPEKKSDPNGGEENSSEAVIPDPKGFELEQIWEQEWQDNLYSINVWAQFGHPLAESQWGKFYTTYESGGSDTPIFTGGIAPDVMPRSTDRAPSSLLGQKGGMSQICIDRYSRDSTDVAFMDGSVRSISLPKLWTLKWHQGWKAPSRLPKLPSN